jgi:hypothetical protein
MPYGNIVVFYVDLGVFCAVGTIQATFPLWDGCAEPAGYQFTGLHAIRG